MVGHFNHRLRAAESDEDESFVLSLSDQLGLECEVGRAEGNCTVRSVTVGRLPPADSGTNSSATVADRRGARYVATAHTAHDQVETILHRLVRGTGLRGLAGIPKFRVLSPLTTLVRPLLHIHRAGDPVVPGRTCSRRFAKTRRMPPRAIRATAFVISCLPMLARDYNPRVEQAVQRLGDLARQSQQVIDGLVDTLRAQCVTSAGRPTACRSTVRRCRSALRS